MNKRPLCWVLLCFAAFLGLLELLGITHGAIPAGILVWRNWQPGKRMGRLPVWQSVMRQNKTYLIFI